MKVVHMHEAEPLLSQLVDEVEHGEEVILARAGVPVARVTAIRAKQPKQRRILGQWRGRVRISEDFDAPLSEADLAAWYGEPT